MLADRPRPAGERCRTASGTHSAQSARSTSSRRPEVVLPRSADNSSGLGTLGSAAAPRRVRRGAAGARTVVRKVRPATLSGSADPGMWVDPALRLGAYRTAIAACSSSGRSRLEGLGRDAAPGPLLLRRPVGILDGPRSVRCGVFTRAEMRSESVQPTATTCRAHARTELRWRCPLSRWRWYALPSTWPSAGERPRHRRPRAGRRSPRGPRSASSTVGSVLLVDVNRMAISVPPSLGRDDLRARGHLRDQRRSEP